MKKVCKDCKVEKPYAELQKHSGCKDGYTALCLECNRARVKQWRMNKPTLRKLQQQREGKKDYARNKHLRYEYGITTEEYNALFIGQSGACKICKIHQSELKKRLSVDHCHKTGTIRGLLCAHCNFMLGYARDNTDTLTEAIRYLSHKTGY